MVDQASGKKKINFTDTKSGMVDNTCEFIHKVKTRGMAIKIIQLHQAGENIKLEKRAESVDWKPIQLVEFEFTLRDTLQYNNLAELAFPYLGGQARAIMGEAHVPDNLQGKVVLETLNCATMLDGL